MPSRFVEVIPDFLYRGGAPEPEEIPILKKEWGIEKIISLDEDSGNKIKQACKKNNIQHIMLPIHGNNHKEILKYIDDKKPVNIVGESPSYVHCKWGKDRTGMFIGRYRTDTEMTAREAVEEAVALGFGIGVDDNSVNQYLQIINNGNEAGTPISLDEYKTMINTVNHCPKCSMNMNNNICPNCSKFMFALDFINKSRGDIVDKNRSDEIIFPMYSTIERSDMLSVPESTPVSVAAYKNNQIRRGLIEAIHDKLIEAQDIQHMTKPISPAEKKQARELIKTLKSFLNLINILVADPVDKMINLFQFNDGINYQTMEDTKSIQHFESFGKNIKKNIWRLVGSRYIDLIDDLKPTTVSDQKANEYKTVFDASMDQLGIFSTDTQIGPMQQTLKDAVRGLVDLAIDLGNYIEKHLKDNNFQQNALNILLEVQKQCAKIKSITQDRIIRKISDDIIGENFKEKDNIKDLNLKY